MCHKGSPRPPIAPFPWAISLQRQEHVSISWSEGCCSVRPLLQMDPPWGRGEFCHHLMKDVLPASGGGSREEAPSGVCFFPLGLHLRPWRSLGRSPQPQSLASVGLRGLCSSPPHPSLLCPPVPSSPQSPMWRQEEGVCLRGGQRHLPS